MAEGDQSLDHLDDVVGLLPTRHRNGRLPVQHFIDLTDVDDDAVGEPENLRNRLDRIELTQSRNGDEHDRAVLRTGRQRRLAHSQAGGPIIDDLESVGHEKHVVAQDHDTPAGPIRAPDVEVVALVAVAEGVHAVPLHLDLLALDLLALEESLQGRVRLRAGHGDDDAVLLGITSEAVGGHTLEVGPRIEAGFPLEVVEIEVELILMLQDEASDRGAGEGLEVHVDEPHRVGGDPVLLEGAGEGGSRNRQGCKHCERRLRHGGASVGPSRPSPYTRTATRALHPSRSHSEIAEPAVSPIKPSP